MKGFFAGVVATLAALAIGAFAYLLLGMTEVRADIPPSQWEVRLMNAAVHASVRREAPDVPNPFPPTDENLIAGGKFYLDDCGGCHGTPGKPFGNNGPVLFPPIPEFPVVGTSYSEAQIFWVGRHGIRRSGMFANGKPVTDENLWTVAAYIKHLNSLPPAVQAALRKHMEAQH